MYDIILTVIGAFLGAFLGGIVTLILSRPSVKVLIAPPLPIILTSGEHLTSLRVKICNEARWWTLRAPVLRCRATATFYSLVGHKIFVEAMVARWANLPQPTSVHFSASNGTVLAYFDVEKFNRKVQVDIYPSKSKPLDIAVRFKGDAECYPWNNDAYMSGDKLRNRNWKLDKRISLVRVEINVSGRSLVRYFRLHNEELESSFRLEAAAQKEINCIKTINGK